MKQIPTASPEETGVPSAAIERLIKRLEHDQVPMHSLLIARHGKMIFEGYYAPYTSKTLHRMFSVTKSFVSLAIGCLEAEGKIRLDDPICKYFPEYSGTSLAATPHPWLTAMTIRHMLEMKSCYSGTTYNKTSTTENWVESFFTAKPVHPSGTIFTYDTSATHVLSALVEKLSGMKLLDYLRGQFLDEIGFSREAYVLPDPFGVSMGGSGLMALPTDLMRLGLLLINEGCDPMAYGAQGRTLYPEAYLKNAVSFHGATIVNAPIKEESYGYGWQFWRFSHNGFGCYGMGGQLVLCYPDEDLVCVTTADTQDMKGGNQFIYNGIYEELFPYLADGPLQENKSDADRLAAVREQLKVPVLSNCVSGGAPGSVSDEMSVPISNQLNGKRWILDKNAGAFQELGISFERESEQELYPESDAKCSWVESRPMDQCRGVMTLTTKSAVYRYLFAFGASNDFIFEPYHQRATASACWLTPHTLYVRIWLVDEFTSSVHFQLDFSDNHLTMQVRKTEETQLAEFTGYWNGELE